METKAKTHVSNDSLLMRVLVSTPRIFVQQCSFLCPWFKKGRTKPLSRKICGKLCENDHTMSSTVRPEDLSCAHFCFFSMIPRGLITISLATPCHVNSLEFLWRPGFHVRNLTRELNKNIISREVLPEPTSCLLLLFLHLLHTEFPITEAVPGDGCVQINWHVQGFAWLAGARYVWGVCDVCGVCCACVVCWCVAVNVALCCNMNE